MQKLASSVALFSLASLASLVSVVGCSGGGEDASDTEAEPLLASTDAAHRESAVVEWNETALEAIRAAGVGPTVAARALAEVHAAQYDAWSAFTKDAVATQPGLTRQPANQRTNHNKSVAVSYAAYRVLVDLFPAQDAAFRARLKQMGGDPTTITTSQATPAGVGNAAAAAVIAFRHADASNQLGDISPGAYSDYTGYSPVNTPETVNDPNRWQPLRVGGQAQSFVTPQWQNVLAFALTDPTLFRPAPPPQNGSAEYAAQAKHLLDLSARLDDSRKAIAEYWSDGPGTAQAPGHWMRLAQFVSARDHYSIDDDAKLFFTLGNAMLDTSIAVWESKRFYDYVRPVTAVRVLYAGKTVRAWAGPNKGTRSIDGATWLPYDEANEVTPPSPEYAAEESAFAFAAAEVLERFTGSGAFGAVHVTEARSSRIEPGHTPRRAVHLCWRTFDDAADQAGRAGQLRGVHFEGSDKAGRVMGKAVGMETWTAALKLFHQGSSAKPHAQRCPDDCDRDDRD